MGPSAEGQNVPERDHQRTSKTLPKWDHLRTMKTNSGRTEYSRTVHQLPTKLSKIGLVRSQT
jgi:hypothetical protein